MSYTVGISTGFWRIARDPSLLGLAQKAGGLGATGGVRFTQIDLETRSEFLEPRLKENMKKMQDELGLEVGIHAEIGVLSALESAERRYWEQAHQRLVEVVYYADKLDLVYVNIHFSATLQLHFEESRLRPFGYNYQVVDFFGRPLWELADKSPAAKDQLLHNYLNLRYSLEEKKLEKFIEDRVENAPEAAKKDMDEYLKSSEYGDFVARQKKALESRGLSGDRLEAALAQVLQEHKQNKLNELTNEKLRRARDPSKEELYPIHKESPISQYFIETGEIGAYLITAHHMKSKNDPLWSNIAGGEDPEKVYNTDPKAFNAAVACKYIEGHLKVKDHRWNQKYLGGKSVLEWLNEKGIILDFEPPEVGGGGGEGHEALYRLYDPKDAYYLIKKINSDQVRICIDFEHMLAHKLDPYDEIPKWPKDMGKYIHLFHLGEPKPYSGTAHIPITRGSQAQEILYDWLYQIRQKGFKKGIIIFERGSGRSGGGKHPGEVFEDSVQVLRQIAAYLEKDVEPDDLPPEFFGISHANEPVYRRQLVAVRDHMLDPLEGLISIPEEKHTFLSKAAIEKNKAKEWDRAKYR